jgi:dTDP-4-dehydrorhamnose reductase
MKKVLVLGSMGMLGSAVVRRLGTENLDLRATRRQPAQAGVISEVTYQEFSVEQGNLGALLSSFGPDDYVVNCIGVIKQRMDDSRSADRIRAIRINSEFPYALSDLSSRQGFRVIQIATDCVFTGAEGNYLENSHHDAIDVYGKTKSLGEVPDARFLNLRCSIIGREVSGATSLVEWLLSQPQGGSIDGYTDHIWNGVTTAVFANLVAGLIGTRSELSGTFHFVPGESISKFELARSVLALFARGDVRVKPTSTPSPTDRTLATLYPETNQELWSLAGAARPATMDELLLTLI